MSRNTYLVIGLIILLTILGFVFFQQRGGREALAPVSLEESLPTVPVAGPQEAAEPAPSVAPAPQPAQPTQPSQPVSKTVVYTDNGFSPATTSIQAGDTILFENKSSRDFWPASAIHPSHAVYPEKGGCIGSAFDACAAIAPGGSWNFTFKVPGAWKYHDHLNASFKGEIVVK